jgi:hypothetical protein
MKNILLSVVVAVILMTTIPGLSHAQWVETNGPGGANVQSLIASSGNLIAGTDVGVFLSTNNGTNWTIANTGLASNVVNCFALKGSNLFAGTYGGGVFISTNNGATWSAVDTGLTDLKISSLAVIGTNVFAGTVSGVFLSTNNGSNWTAVNSGLPSLNILSLAVIGTHLFAEIHWPSAPHQNINAGLFLTTDDGNSWITANSSGTNRYISTLASSDTILLGGYGGLYRSTDYGATWTTVDSGLPNPVTVFCLAGTGKYIFAGTYTDGVLGSSDNGVTWTAVGTLFPYYPVAALCVKDTMLFAGTPFAGVFRTKVNGTDWTAVNRGLWTVPNDLGEVLSFASTGSTLLAATDAGVFRSTDNGDAWTPVANLYVTSFVVHGDDIYAGAWNAGVFRSTNGGTTWFAANSGMTATQGNTIAMSGDKLFAATAYAFFVSTNKGTTWTTANPIPTNNSILCLAVSDTNLFAGTGGTGVFRSADNGSSWTAINSGLPNLKTILSLAVSDTNLFAGTYDAGVFLTTNSGTSWTEVDNGLTSHQVLCFAVIGATVFAGTHDGGVFRSQDKGASWTAVNAGLTGSAVSSLTVNGTFLYAGSPGRVIFKRPLVEMGVDPGGATIPATVRLEQNFPNPFNPTTTIRYSVPHGVYVTLTIFNILGQQVATLVNETHEAGFHYVKFDGSGLASGVYFYRLQAGEYVASKRLILVR